MRQLTELELDQVSGGAGAYRSLLQSFSANEVTSTTQGLKDLSLAMPEFDKAKPGSWQAVFDAWEDRLEIHMGFNGLT